MGMYKRMITEVTETAKYEQEEREKAFQKWKEKSKDILESQVYVKDVEEMIEYFIDLMDNMSDLEFRQSPSAMTVDKVDIERITSHSFIGDEIIPHLDPYGGLYEKAIDIFVMHEYDEFIPFYIFNDIVYKIREQWWFESYTTDSGEIFKNMSKYVVWYVEKGLAAELAEKAKMNMDPEKKISMFDKRRKKND